MKRVFVKTSNVARFLAAVQSLQLRGAEEACLLVVDGEPGISKSATVTWWAAQTGSVYVRAKAAWTPPWMLRELLGCLGVTPAHSFERMYAQALDALGQRARVAEREGADFGVVIDELDHIIRSARCLETLRDLSDLLEIPFVLVGMGRIADGIRRYPQIASRTAPPVEFQRGSRDDIRALVDGLCEVPVGDCLVDFLHRASGGLVREAKEGIGSIERFGRRQGGETVTVEAMAGEVLLADRQTGKPIVVRA